MLRAVIPAAGKGTRSGLSFPKTLQIVEGKPILIRLLERLESVDSCPAVITSPDGRDPIAETVRRHEREAEYLVQDTPRGMGNAVHQFARSATYDRTDALLVIWGDMLSLSREVIEGCVARFQADGADFAFPTIRQDPCYTWVRRGPDGRVIEVLERRELGDMVPPQGEADCGLFIFRKGPLFTLLDHDDQELVGRKTGEINFLPSIGALVKRGYDVRAYPMARAEDAFSFNSPEDLRAYEAFRSRRYTGTGTLT